MKEGERMQYRSYKEITHIGHRAMFEAMRNAGERVNPDEAAKEMEVLVRKAKLDPKSYRDARAEFRHHREMGVRKEMYRQLIKYLSKLEDKYGYRSLPFQYMLEAVSCVTRTSDQVRKEYVRNPNPPAYDKSRRSPYSIRPEDADEDEAPLANLGREMRRAFFKWIDTTNDPVIEQIKKVLHNPREYTDGNGQIRLKSKRYVLTRNGSSSGIVFKGDKLMDIEAQCFKTDTVDEHVYPNISDYFGILNLSPEDPAVYLQLEDTQEGCLGFHTVVPDKDGKSREVYYFLPVIAAVGKGIADALDKGMRLLPGIYTYDQKLWIEEALDRNWNNLGMIITVDMEKFSDTIVRSYLMTLLVHLGIPKKVVREMDDLYSLPIWDTILNKSLGVHEVVLQGEYSVFMIMSLLNLCLQRYIIWAVDNKVWDQIPLSVSRLLSAVLGDDTALKFESTDFPRAWKLINDQYGAFGMMINDLKSDHIINGVGQGDFAKTHFDKYGIIDHLNPKNVDHRNIDGIINDILWMSKSTKYKRRMLESLFDKEIAANIMDLSIINGGSNDRPIEIRDVYYLINNVQKLNLQYREMDQLEEERVIDNISLEYRKLGLGLINSPLYYYVDKSLRDPLENMNKDEQDDLIKVSVLNADTIGMDLDYDLLPSLVGKIPSELHHAYANSRLFGYETEDSRLWGCMREYDQFVAKRKSEKKGNFSSLYLSCMNGAKETMEAGYYKVPFAKVSGIKNMDDYRKQEKAYKSGITYRIMRSENIWIYREWHWGTEHSYVSIPYEHEGRLLHKTRRLYYAWNSKYEALSKEEFNVSLKPLFLKHGRDIAFEEFWELYR